MPPLDYAPSLSCYSCAYPFSSFLPEYITHRIEDVYSNNSMGAVLYSNSGSISVKPAMPTPNKNSFAIMSVIFALLPCFYLKQSYGCVSCQFLSHVWPEYLVNFLCFGHILDPLQCKYGVQCPLCQVDTAYWLGCCCCSILLNKLAFFVTLTV